MVAYQMVQNYLIIKYCLCSAHLQKVKSYQFHGSFAFSSIQTVHAFTIIYFVSALQLDWLQSLKQFFINVSHHILVASLTLMALF